MTFQNEDNQTLTGLGLTILQARIYLALAKLGKATVITISKASKVTRPDVYRILSELQELGLVEKIISMPTEFEAIPIDGCLSLLLQRRNNQTAELQRKARKLLQKRTKNNEKVKLQEKEFQLILLSGTRKLHKSKKAFENAQTSISIVTKRGGKDVYICCLT